MKLNGGGLKLCAAYFVCFILLIALAILANGVASGFLVALSILPGALVLGLLGVFHFIPPDYTPILLFVAFLLSCLIVYLVGWFFSVIINFKDPSAPTPDEPPDWHKR